MHLCDASGGVTIQGADLSSTFTDLGMPWIDKAVLRRYEWSHIFPIMAANMVLGGFLPEVERFLATIKILPESRWQSILYRSGLYENAYLSYFSTKSMLEDSSEWVESKYHIVCIALSQRFRLGYVGDQGVRHFLFYAINWPSKNRSDIVPIFSLRRHLKCIVGPDVPDFTEVANALFCLNRDEASTILSTKAIPIDFCSSVGKLWVRQNLRSSMPRCRIEINFNPVHLAFVE